MAHNKFASMLNRKTNRLTLVLVYALLEWALIFFLLLNSLFSYLIIKFANYFGLKPPCLVCSRIDHIFEPQNSKSSYRDLICDHHAIELSRSGYCFNHRKLVESQDMCEDCGASSSRHGNHHHHRSAVVENCDVNLWCSCCGVNIKSEILDHHAFLIKKPSSVVLEDTTEMKKKNINEPPHDVDFDGEPDRIGSDSLGVEDMEKDGIERSRDIQFGPQSDLTKEDDHSSESFSFWLSKEGYSLVGAEEDEGDVVLEAEAEPLLIDSYADEKILPQHLDFYIDLDDYKLIPVELADSETEKHRVESQDDDEEGDQKIRDQGKCDELWRVTDEELVVELDVRVEPASLDAVEKLNSSSIDVGVELDEIKMMDFSPREKGQEEEVKREVGDAVVLDEDEVEIIPAIEEGQAASTTDYIDFHVACDEEGNVPLSTSDDEVAEKRDVMELSVNILTSDFGDVCHKENDEIDISQVAKPLRPCNDECPSTDDVICEASTTSPDLLEKGDYEPKQTEKAQNHNNITVEIAEPELQSDTALSHESSEMEGDRIPDTYNSAYSLQHLHKETLDDSTGNEVDGGEEVTAFEDLKSLLESERKALRALYAELDEERNAAAVATNQTMAMINRLQEEKATIEMEALQYQRMMEEQSEYDQEALQLMNEMLIKREKELQELEKELEVCRKKVVEYEERERMRLLSQRKDRSFCCSNGEESDDLSVDLNNESREEDGDCKCEGNGHQQNTPVDAILDLQDSLRGFEEERLSILEQLKALEEKLCTLSEEEEHHIENMKPFEQFYEENAAEFDTDFKLNGLDNGKHYQERRLNGSKPKQLLPLFDAAEIDSDGELSNGVEDGSDPLTTHKPLPTKYELEKKRVAIEEEVDHVYERLHALEADREFVKHCVGSLRKGDKGVHLLQQILQHLRDLKHVELEARSVCGPC